MRSKYLLIALPPLCFFILGEYLARVAHFRHHSNVNRILERLPPIENGRVVEVHNEASFVQPHENPRLIFELRPNLEIKFIETSVRTNKWGARGRDVPRNKPRGVVRIVGLGCSYMFGWGIEEADTFLSVLERELNQRFPQKQWETINFAVPGYNLVQKVESLYEKGLRLSPDIVILNYVNRDLRLPDFVPDQPNYFRWDRSYLLHFVTNDVFDFFDLMQFHMPPRGLAPPRYLNSDFQHLKGELALRSSLQRFLSIKDTAGFTPLLYVTNDRPPGIAKTLQQWAKQNRIPFLYREQNSGLEYFVSETNHHPNPTENALMANALVEKMQVAGIIESYLQPPQQLSESKIDERSRIARVLHKNHNQNCTCHKERNPRRDG